MSGIPQRGRECDCPAWVVQCVHFDGKVLVLASPASVRAEGKRRGASFAPHRRLPWAVYGPAVWAEDGPDALAATGLVRGPVVERFGTKKAIADEFRRREAELVEAQA